MPPALNPFAEPYYQHSYQVQSFMIFYNFPPHAPCYFPPLLQNNSTFYHYSLLHPKLLHAHRSSTSTAAFNLEVSAAAESKKVMINKEEEEEDVHLKREAINGTAVIKRSYNKRCVPNRRCQRTKVQNKYPSTSTCDDDDFQFKDPEDAVRRNITTVMIKNLPNKLDKKYILKLVDEHCLAVNKKLQADGDSAFSEFDFLYLPIDFKTGCNFGFAFVNLNTPTAAYRLYQEFHKKSWAYLGSNKECEVKCARIQGLRELLGHFSNSIFSCASIEYLPVHFTPNRNGFCVITGQQYIGRHNGMQK